MTRFKAICGVALLLAGLLLVITVTNSSASHASPASSSHGPAARVPVSQIDNSGVPAIPAHPSTGVAANNTSAPSFTKNDVIAYLNKYGFPVGPLVPGAHLKILTLQFVTARQASILMKGESVGVPDNSLVCYVKVQGPFLLENIHAPKSYTRTTADIGDMVFDAHTGNLLTWGFY